MKLLFNILIRIVVVVFHNLNYCRSTAFVRQKGTAKNMLNRLCHIEFNEVNFDLVSQYLDKYPSKRWKNIRQLVSLECVVTSSELEYENLEPWIQWASVHTGKSAAEHKVFRLGDINECPHEQVFELLESEDVSVGCISAMNAENRLENPAYFIPDPWTYSSTDGSFFSRKIYEALTQAVNDNSSGRITKKSLFYLVLALAVKTKFSNWPLYFRTIFRAFNGKKWNKALFLDLFISDLHLSYFNKYQPQFTTVFFNALAHIQHHYYFNSQFYKGTMRNPNWYIRSELDPFLDALDVYDIIIGNHFECFDRDEILTTTALRQVPFTKEMFYYRLTNHFEFLTEIGVNDFVVHPRMTRDFLIEFSTQGDCLAALKTLRSVTIDSIPVFGLIDNRGKSLFVTLTYSKMLDNEATVNVGNNCLFQVKNRFVFVAVKNGMHDGKGYCFSSRPGLNFRALHGAHVKGVFAYILSRFAEGKNPRSVSKRKV